MWIWTEIDSAGCRINHLGIGDSSVTVGEYNYNCFIDSEVGSWYKDKMYGVFVVT